ncbi:hypothetical protein OH77DRAFT_1518105 [Trametes cingulata]|nr:hypothetical protein OH77DRAFT_1518105 [Trametes cingulata]
MPRDSIDTSAASSSRRVTRSMTKTKPLEDIVNTTTSGAPSSKTSQSKARRAYTSRTRREQAAKDENAPSLATKSARSPSVKARRDDLSFQAGDKVEVYMRWRGRYSWQPGKVILGGPFQPRKTSQGYAAYPVLLDQRLPRIVHWFDEGKGHIVKGRP